MSAPARSPRGDRTARPGRLRRMGRWKRGTGTNMWKAVRRAATAAALVAMAATGAAAQPGSAGLRPEAGTPANAMPDALQHVKFEPQLGRQVPLDTPFRDETGKTVRLGDFFHGRPVILVLAYYQCPMLCTMVLNGVVSGLKPLAISAGKDFDVIVVSFNPPETSVRAKAKKRELPRPLRASSGTEDGWHFLTGDAASIDRSTAPSASGTSTMHRDEAVRAPERHRPAHAGREGLALPVRGRVRAQGPEARPGRGVAGQDRNAHRPGAALLLPLRSRDRPLQRRRDESRARGGGARRSSCWRSSSSCPGAATPRGRGASPKTPLHSSPIIYVPELAAFPDSASSSPARSTASTCSARGLLFFSVLIAVLVLVLAVKYRRRRADQIGSGRAPAGHPGDRLERRSRSAS